MEARVTRAFMGRPDAEIATRTIAAGEIIKGDLAAVAVREGWAEDLAVSEKPATAKRKSGK